MSTRLKRLGWGVLFLLGAITVVAAGAFLWLRGSLPAIEGDRTLPGLAAPVEVIRDERGIPHIVAESEEDALFGSASCTRRIGCGRWR